MYTFSYNKKIHKNIKKYNVIIQTITGGRNLRSQIRIGTVLTECGYITEEQVDIAIQVQKTDRTKRLGQIMIELGFITEEQLLLALSQRLSVPYKNLNETIVELKAVELIPKSISLKYKILAIQETKDRVVLALNDPLDFYAIEDVKSFINRQCDIVLVGQDLLEKAIIKYYAEIDAKSAVYSANERMQGIEVEVTQDLEVDDSDEPVIHLINSILLKAYSDGASDIHFEPYEQSMAIRLRIDGQLIDYTCIDRKMVQYITTRIKILAELDIAERRLPQDGNFRIKVSGEEIGVRASTVPTVFGEKTVLRFLAKANKLDYADQYGMNRENYEKLERILMHPHGVVYITGPTGSGKTTTLYMIIEKMAKEAINICTIEDPVERHLERVTQVQVNPKAGLTFEGGLRAMLRQDPDVILVGETRDSETAAIAVTSAITGHLVLSTLHTNDAISSIVRLNDMGIESYLLANSLVGVVAQRLIKKVCPHCKEVYEPTEIEQEKLRGIDAFYRGKGCHQCSYSGYKGRIAVHEVLEIDADIRHMISNKVETERIYQYVREQNQLRFIKDHVRELVKEGITTVDEYIRQTAFMI